MESIKGWPKCALERLRWDAALVLAATAEQEAQGLEAQAVGAGKVLRVRRVAGRLDKTAGHEGGNGIHLIQGLYSQHAGHGVQNGGLIVEGAHDLGAPITSK